jgi:predicted nucleic acid-binding protein
VTPVYSLDTSAWNRHAHPALRQRIARELEADTIAICDQVRLEVLYSARSAADYDALLGRLSALHVTPSGPDVWPRAIEVQRRLAHVGGLHHRSVKIADLVIAASAELAGHTVLHYDEDFDRIAAITGQSTEWVAPRGTA